MSRSRSRGCPRPSSAPRVGRRRRACLARRGYQLLREARTPATTISTRRSSITTRTHLAKREEVRKERVEVWLRPQVQDGLVVRVVEVRKHAQQLAVDELDRVGEGWVEVLARLGGEDVLVVKYGLHGAHDGVNVVGCGEVDLLLVLVRPEVVEARSCAHVGAGLLRADLGEHTIELV